MSRQQGFTLIELMIVLVIIGLFMALALPSFQASIRNSAREEAAVGFANALALARSEAVTRGVPIMVSPNQAADEVPGNGFYSGGVWSVRTQSGAPAFAGSASPVIETFQVTQVDTVSSAAIANLNTQFVFSPKGTLNQAAAVDFCFNGDGNCSQARVNLVGRAQISVVAHP